MYTLVQMQVHPTASIKSIMVSDDLALINERKTKLSQAGDGEFVICCTDTVQLSRKALCDISQSYELDLLEETLCDRLREAGCSLAAGTDPELTNQMVSHAYHNMREMDEYDAITETIEAYFDKLQPNKDEEMSENE